MTSLLARRGTPSLVLALALAACAPFGPAPTTGDRVPEVMISATTLVAQYQREGDHLVSPILDTPDRATVAGLLIETHEPDVAIRFEARGIDERGRTGRWIAAEETWREGVLSVGRVDLGVIAIGVELRVRADEVEALDVLTWAAVVPEPLEPTPTTGYDTTSSPLSPSLASAGVHSRADWGARATQCSSLDSAKYRMAVHHTVSPPDSNGNIEARLRATQAFHMDSRGWCDVGYHFFVTIDGQLWEAREARFLGAHVGSQNDGNAGVVFVGCFQPGDPTCDQAEFGPTTPPEVMINEGGRLLGLLSRDYGITVSASSVLGHRQHAGANTGCPGDALFARMADLRAIAAGGGPGPTTGSARGVVFDLSITQGPSDPGNLRIATAEVTASTGDSVTVRAGDAFWSFDLPPGHYSVTAVAPGYDPATREVDVTAAGETWGSIGLVPTMTQPQPLDVAVLVYDASLGRDHALAGALVTLGAEAPVTTSSSGQAAFRVLAGATTLSATKAGFVAASRSVTIGGAGPVTLEIALTPEAMMMMNPDPMMMMEEPDPDDGSPEPMVPAEEEEEGCGCTTSRTQRAGSSSLLWVCAAAFAVRRRQLLPR